MGYFAMYVVLGAHASLEVGAVVRRHGEILLQIGQILRCARSCPHLGLGWPLGEEHKMRSETEFSKWGYGIG